MARIAAPAAVGAVLAALIACPAAALEYPIGAPKNPAGMEVAAVYLQPIEMEPDVLRDRACACGGTGSHHELPPLLEATTDEAVNQGHLPGV